MSYYTSSLDKIFGLNLESGEEFTVEKVSPFVMLTRLESRLIGAGWITNLVWWIADIEKWRVTRRSLRDLKGKKEREKRVSHKGEKERMISGDKDKWWGERKAKQDQRKKERKEGKMRAPSSYFLLK